ncbi:MAG: hypothetical protein K6G73_05065 [Marinilabiliaceae bacterium]|nr:hypothetical protein [Marinilabiliaceae bacterium]
MNPLYKMLSISVICVVCASNVCAQGRSLAFSSDVGTACAQRGGNIIKSLLGEALKEGRSILISAYGHNVRLQAINDEGLVIDDPYGKVYDFSKSGATPKYYQKGKYDQRNGNNLGKDNLWKWSDLQTNNIIIKYAEIYSIND